MPDEVVVRDGNKERNPANGQLLPGHAPLPGGGRPPGALNKLTRSLREQTIEGLDDIVLFVRELKRDYPTAAAALLAKMMPSVSEEADMERAPYAPPALNFFVVKSGEFVNNGEVVSEAEIRKAHGLPKEKPPRKQTKNKQQATPPDPIGQPTLVVDNEIEPDPPVAKAKEPAVGVEFGRRKPRAGDWYRKTHPNEF